MIVKDGKMIKNVSFKISNHFNPKQIMEIKKFKVFNSKLILMI
jgi:hypothetical protein